MKYLFIILFILISNNIFANEDDSTEVEVIDLHESKSLDQMVLENLNEEDEIEEIIEDTNKTDEAESNEDEVGDGATGVDKSNWEVLQIGFAQKPDPNVAFKAGYRINYYGGTEASGASPGDAGTSKTYFNFGLGYQY